MRGEKGRTAKRNEGDICGWNNRKKAQQHQMLTSIFVSSGITFILPVTLYTLLDSKYMFHVMKSSCLLILPEPFLKRLFKHLSKSLTADKILSRAEKWEKEVSS